ncbi:MAG: hypothetical protein R3281_04020 [Balneolaceae bacterium]|nr:hypothetical protein [Balneolaceae bacterium]
MTRNPSIIPLPLFLLLFLFAADIRAQDGFFMNRHSPAQRHLSLGIQPVVLTQSQETMLLLRGAYGVNGSKTLHGKVGLFEDKTYLGGHIRFGIAAEPRSPVNISLLARVHVWKKPGLKLSVIAGKQAGQAGIYSGISYEPVFP